MHPPRSLPFSSWEINWHHFTRSDDFFLLLSTFICWTCFLAVAALATVTTSYCHRATIQSLKSFKRRKTAALTTWQWYIRWLSSKLSNSSKQEGFFPFLFMSTCTVDGFHLSIWSSFPDRNIVCFLLFPFSPSQLPYMAYGRTMVVEAVSPPLLPCWVMFATTTTTYVPPSGFSTKLCANCLMLNSSPRLVLLGILYDNIRLVALL